MDDNLADYRRFCASRLKRLERCKKTKNIHHFGSTEISSINTMSPIAKANPKKLSIATDSCVENNQKSTLISDGNNNFHLPSLSCSSSHRFSTAASLTMASRSSIFSTNNLESETRTAITIINDNNDYGDSNRRSQRNFDLLREKMSYASAEVSYNTFCIGQQLEPQY
ncbi:hypothetical protein DINM_005245 [Dirofilaria immitis]|nr:hypothetical protein [Dirofilaria immitis]